MKLENVKIADLKPHPKNYNRHPESQIRDLAASLDRFRQYKNIVIDEDDFILAGHGLVEAAQYKGIESIDCYRFTDLSEEDKEALVVADNELPKGAEPDLDLLAELLGDMKSPETVPGVTDQLLSELGVGVAEPESGLTDDDSIPEADETESICKAGDMWQLGNHRLLCGDCTDAGNVERLMGGEKADLVFSDPPYGVDYDGGTKKREKLKGDSNSNLYLPFLEIIKPFLNNHCAVYLFYADGDSAIVSAIVSAGYKTRNNLIWNKNVAQFGALSAQYKQKHEPFLYAHIKNKSPQWFGPTNETTVWDIKRDHKNDFHPTQKPVEIPVRCFMNSSKENQIIYDGFGGSGTTLVACEKTNRKCRMIEIDEKYCDVIIKRWQDYTGNKAVKI